MIAPQLILIPREFVANAWGQAEPYLAKVVARGAPESTAQWFREAREGRRQLWFIWSDKDGCRGAGITSLSDTPSGKLCVIDAFAAAPKNPWLATLPVLEAWARSQGCKGVRIYGRVGWVEKLKDYTLSGVILDRKLS